MTNLVLQYWNSYNNGRKWTKTVDVNWTEEVADKGSN